jgi:Asp/Glu/hydantoin racemase
MLERARRLHAGCRGATVVTGSPYIIDRETLCAASRAVDEFVGALTVETLPDALIVGCFGDPGVRELRKRVPFPVLGLAEASCRVACRMGGRFGIVTGGTKWPPILEALLADVGLASCLSGVHALELTGDRIARDPAAARSALKAKISEARMAGADSVILGGAGLMGLADALQAEAAVPLLDCVDCAVSEATALVIPAAYNSSRSMA